MCPFTGFYLFSLTIAIKFRFTWQFCPEEVSDSGLRVTWYQSPRANYIRSDPLCFHNGTLITRNCTGEDWVPPLDEVPPCYTAVKHLDPSSCPPGFQTVSDNFNKYCYQIGETSPWGFPCVGSGGATVITELNKKEIQCLLDSLNTTDYTHLWLPAQRQKMLAPIVWSTPGPNWGRYITANAYLPLRPTFFKNCLLLDVKNRTMVTDLCTREYPTLCIYLNDFHYSAKCPVNYHAFRYMLDDGRCFGIEKSETQLTFDEFLQNKCESPLGNGEYTELRRFIYSRVAEVSNLSNNTWCWYATPDANDKLGMELFPNNRVTPLEIPPLARVINNDGSIGLMHSLSALSCVACETKMIYGETEFLFEYDEEQNMLYLTIYFPSGLWKYNNNDRGVQCFSDAEGFFRVIDINDLPILNVELTEPTGLSKSYKIEKITYAISLVTDRSARYWCEGHTKSFALIITDKILVNPHGSDVHVFSLVLKLNMSLVNNLIFFNETILIENITSIFRAKKVLMMDVLEYDIEAMMILLHLHVPINETHSDKSRNLVEAIDLLKSKAEVEFPKYRYVFINMSSSLYCLPTTSVDYILLDWGLTPIGSIAAPNQFCLQAKGLPVNRQCRGSYLLGSIWGDVQGQCDASYKPSRTTIFLFNIIKGNLGTNYMSRFLTDGLGFVLEEVDLLIPADVYYLSLSFISILDIAQKNISLIETGDIDNIAWVVDRMMSVNDKYLRLAQRLNSTNVILESINNIIEIITKSNFTANEEENVYKLAIQPQFIVQISYPELCNVTGVAIIRKGISDNFTDMIVKPLFKNTTLNDVILIRNLELATWLPHYVLDNLRKTPNMTDNLSGSNTLQVLINAYNNNSIFQELTENNHSVNSRILEITIPGYVTNLEYPVPLIFREKHSTDLPKACGYWDFQTGKGSWSKLGCRLVTLIENLTVCECYHLTHFAQLINLRGVSGGIYDSVSHETHKTALNIITLVGSFLSLLGIVGIWVTATVFDTWRKKAGTKVLLQLSIAVGLPLVLIIIFNLDTSIFVEVQGRHVVQRNMVVCCVILGALFHYSVLANFMWMLITAILQFIRYVKVLGVSRPSRFMIKLALIGWGFPCIPVLIVLLIDHENYVPNASSGRSFCYPNGVFMIAGVIAPVCIILATNVILFLLVIKSISKSSNMQATDKSLVYAQFRLSIFLFFLLGLTWIFGVASFSGQLIWSYLFCLTSTVQGFVLFIYFIICDPNTRNMWATIMKPQFGCSQTSIVSISSE